MVNFKSAHLNLVSLCFYPETGISLSDKLTDCYRQFSKITLNKGFGKELVVKETIFIAAQSMAEYVQSKQKLLACAMTFFEELPPTSILPQSPDNDSLVLEVICLEGALPGELTLKSDDQARWCVFQREDIKLVFAAGLASDKNLDILTYSTKSFARARHILQKEGMDFSNIVRQWNYIEQITINDIQENKVSQHYQVFNDVRSKYYGQASFSNGFPAATGIGMDFGGICIDFIAANLGQSGAVTGIKSPVQFDAYTYSKEVLAENCSMNDFCRTTPKFERAKLIEQCGAKWIFISGTAAIIGQDSSPLQSVEHQTEMTIQNIERLISSENLLKHGINASDDPEITYLRIYIKHKSDILSVKQICRKHFKHVQMVFVVADICRPELLVEIEGHAILG